MRSAADLGQWLYIYFVKLLLIIALCAGVVLAGCGEDDSSAGSSNGGVVINANGPGPAVTVPDTPPPKEYVTRDLKEGSGPAAKVGDAVAIEYVTATWEGGPYSNSWEDPQTASFVLGAHELRGLDRGIRGMKAGGRRELIVPTRDRYFPSDKPVNTDPEEGWVSIVDLLEIR